MNGLTPPKSGAAEWPPGPTPRASRGAPEPSDSFAGILNSQARTATAEGQDRSPKTEGRNRRDDDSRVAVDRREADNAKCDRPVQHHEDAAEAKPADPVAKPADAAPVAEAQAAAEAQTAVVVAPQVPVETQTQTQTQAVAAPVVAQPETQAQNAPAQAQVVAPQAQPVVQQPVAHDAKPAAEAPVQPQQQAPVQQQPAVQADEAAPVVQQPQQQTDAKPVDDKPVQPAAVQAAKPKQAQPDTGQQQNQSQQGQQQPQAPADQARSAAQAYGRTAQQHTSTEVPTTAQSGTPAAPAATPVASGQPAAARGELAPPTPVPLARAAQTVEHVLRLASSRGVTHARIALKPESLGSIDVHLRHTSDGLVAKLVAHAPEAVQQLQQAAADLRQQLEGQGVNLLSLDIGQSSGEQRSAAGADAGFGDQGRGENGGPSDTGADAGAEAEVTVKSNLQLPDGVLVDVLA